MGICPTLDFQRNSPCLQLLNIKGFFPQSYGLFNPNFLVTGQEMCFFSGREWSWLLCGWQPAPWRLFTSFPAHRVDASLPRALPDPTSSIPHHSVPSQVQVPGRLHAALQEPHCTARGLPALAPWEAPVSEGSSPWLPSTPHVRPNEHGDLRIEDKHPNEPEESCSRSWIPRESRW